MNIVRDGIMLAVYTFGIILAFIFLSNPLALMISNIAAASSEPMMLTVKNEVIAVFGICTALAVLIPTIIFAWLAFTTNQEEYLY